MLQFREQSTLTGVAQAVVDKMVRIHHDVYMSGSSTPNGHSRICGKRDDITLLVRNFNYPLPNAINSPTNPVVRFNPIVTTVPSASWNIYEESTENSVSNTITSNTYEEETNDKSGSETSSDIFSINQNPVDKNSRIKPYVDFTDFYNNVEKARQEGRLPSQFDL